MGLKWPLVPQSETRETHFRSERFFISANLCRLSRFERRPHSPGSAGLDSELHPFWGIPLQRTRRTMITQLSFQPYRVFAVVAILASALTGCFSSPAVKKQRFFNQGEQAFQQQ